MIADHYLLNTDYYEQWNNGTMQIKTISLKILLILSVLLPGSVFAQSNAQPPVVVRASLTPKESIWVGQRVALHIDVLGRDGWAQIKHFRDFEISGTLVLRIETQGTRIQETLSGESYSGQRYELLVFPKRAGTIQVPAVPLEVEIKRWGADAKPSVERLNTPALQFQANLPPGAQREPDLISTKEFQAQQQWEPESEQVKIGDSLKRTFTFQAADVPGLAFMPLSFDPIDGVAVYPAQPLVEDRSDRGSLTGFRRETVTYVLQAPGKVQLPDVIITWWDMTNKELKRETLPGRTLDVAPNPAVQASAASRIPVKRSATGKWWWALLVLTMIAALAWAFHHWLQSRWQRWRQEQKESEKAYFQRFVKAARSGNPAKALNTLMQWLDRINSNAVAARLDQFLEAYSDPRVAKEAQRLVQAIDSKTQTQWHSSALIKGIVKARQNWMAQQHRSKTANQCLPLLNP